MPHITPTSRVVPANTPTSSHSASLPDRIGPDFFCRPTSLPLPDKTEPALSSPINDTRCSLPKKTELPESDNPCLSILPRKMEEIKAQNNISNQEKRILYLNHNSMFGISNKALFNLLPACTGSQNVCDLSQLPKSNTSAKIEYTKQLEFMGELDKAMQSFLGNMLSITDDQVTAINHGLVNYFAVKKPHNNLANFLFDCLRKGNYATIETVLGIETARICEAIIKKIEDCKYDAFVMPGNSSNIPPLFYETPSDIPYSHASPHQPAEYSGEHLQSTLQVLFNICTYTYAVKNNKPIAGICNGLQIMAICNNYQLAHNGKSGKTHSIITIYDNPSAAKTETFSHAYSVVTVENQKCRTQPHHGLKDPDGTRLLPKDAIGYLIDEWGNVATQNHSELALLEFKDTPATQSFIINFGKQIRDMAHGQSSRTQDVDQFE